MTRPRFLWPIYRFRDGMKERVATFFEYGDAVTFINDREQHIEFRECYVGEPRYDRRERADLTPKELPNGRFQVAA